MSQFLRETILLPKRYIRKKNLCSVHSEGVHTDYHPLHASERYCSQSVI
nr:MAG TPA: hypothetical protein [Caudoviricetes sp.]